MYTLTNLSATNFMSFIEINLSLDSRCYVVRGNNKYNKGQKSNGSGKTSLLEVIAITLLGQSLTNRDLKSCVNRYSGENYFTVSVTLKNDKDTVIIKRLVYSNTKSQELSITINDQPISDVPTKAGVENGVDLRLGNQWILSTLLDISKEDLLNYYLISDKHYKGFLSSGNNDKIAVISRFSNATVVDRAIENIEKNKKQNENKALTLTREIDSLRGQIEGLQYTISEEAKLKFEQDKERKLKSLEPNVERLTNQLTELEHKATDLGRSQFECEEFYGRLNEEKRKELVSQKNEIAQLKREIDQLIAQVDNKLMGVIECPACKHKFIVNSEEESVEELNITLVSSKEDLVVVEQQLKETEDNIEGDRLMQEIDRQIDQLVDQQQAALKSWELLQEQITSIQGEQFQSQDITDKLSSLENKIQEKEKQFDVLVKEVDDYNTWIDRFERFKYFLINKPISIICHKTNEVLRKINSEYTISIDGFKKLKTGELRAELTPTVHINGLESESYASFSTGERTRLDLACDLAIQQMINSTSKGGLNFYFSDEKISGLDETGIELVAKTFNDLGKTMLLVSHSGSEISYQNVITVEKTNKQSVLI